MPEPDKPSPNAMKEKLRPLVMLVAVSFLLPLGEAVVLRRPLRPFDQASIIDAFLMIYATYWWYSIDRRERNFRTGALQNIGVILLAPVALPVYFFRSRGFGKGLATSIAAFGILVATGILGVVGEEVGAEIAPRIVRQPG